MVSRMPSQRLVSVISLALALSGLTIAQGTTSSCGGSKGPVCAPYDGGFPDLDAGEQCRFPCPVATEGDGAGGDTYANFADGFFTTYCVRCHSTTRTQNCTINGSLTCRSGAPSGYNWDDPASIASHRAHIRAVVAVGDELTMPPDLPLAPDPNKPAPTCFERFRIARWIDSGAPGL
jgi:hypothetical protein